MKRCYWASLGLITFLAVGCRTTENSSKVKDAESNVDPKRIPVLKCETGDTASFLMKKGPDAKLTDFPALDGVEEIATTTSDYITRLDVCMQDDVPVVKRAVTGFTDAATVVTVTTGATFEGLKEAIFDQDYSQLKVRIPFVKLNKFDELKDSKELFYLQGSTDGKSAVATIAVEDEGKLAYSSIGNAGRLINVYQSGILEYQDPAADKDCATQANTSGTFTLGTATFAWLGQQTFGTSGGAAPILCQITVVDTAKQLGAKAGKAVKVEIALGEPSDFYKFKRNHHSVCDSFILKTADATYAATASLEGFGGGACSGVIAGAPEAAKVGTNFLFTYGTKTVEGNEKNCLHPTRQCPTSAASSKIFKKSK